MGEVTDKLKSIQEDAEGLLNEGRSAIENSYDDGKMVYGNAKAYVETARDEARPMVKKYGKTVVIIGAVAVVLIAIGAFLLNGI